MTSYILSFDQSTSTTKALLFDQKGALVERSDIPHKQLIDEKGWVEHDPHEILTNLYQSARNLLDKSGINPTQIKGIAISNQRETALAWNRTNGEPLHNAIVWQCGRAKDICKSLEKSKKLIHERTGLHLSPYFSAAKFSWMLKNVPSVLDSCEKGELVFSTVDSFLLYHLTKGKVIKTEYSNASRTQLLNIETLMWDPEIANLFSIPLNTLPELSDSNSIFGYTNLDGILDREVPICAILGDSQGALYAQGCLEQGMTKATYGTGSSIMMNIGDKMVLSNELVTSIAWGIDGALTYVLEGNINYSGAIISYLIEDLQLINSPKEAEPLAKMAQDIEGLYMVPAFSGLGAPYWDPNARAAILGMDRRCGKAELVKAAEEAIGYQIADIIFRMNENSKQKIQNLRVDGGATNDSYLMQFQADILQTEVCVAAIEELSGQGPALLAARKLGLLHDMGLLWNKPKAQYSPQMSKSEQFRRYEGWKKAVETILNR